MTADAIALRHLADGNVPRVMVADGTRVGQLVLLSALRRLGCEAEAVDAGDALLARLERCHCHLVLIDVALPGLDAPATARRLRERRPADDLPILAIAADRSGAADLLAAGAQDVLLAPVTLEALAAALDRWLGPDMSAPPADGANGALAGAGAAPAVLDQATLASMRELEVIAGQPVLRPGIRAFLDHLDALLAGLAAPQLEAVRMAAHTLAGSANTIGAFLLGARAGDLEAAARAGDAAECLRRLAAVQSEAQAAREALAALLRAEDLAAEGGAVT